MDEINNVSLLYINNLDMKKRRTWTNEELQEEALKYQYKKDFIAYSGSAYVISLKRKICGQICKHMLPLNSLSKKDIYFIVCDKTKEIYIGISFCVHKRYVEHCLRGTDLVKSLLAKEHRLILVEKNLDLKSSIERENYWIRYFKKRHWKLMNQRKGTSVGLYLEPVWTKDKVLSISQEYTGTITSFKLLYPGAYAHALRHDYHNELFQKTKSLNLPKCIVFLNEEITIPELSKRYNINKGTINQRYIRGDRDLELIRPLSRKRKQCLQC